MANNMSLDALKAHLFETLEGIKNLSDAEADPCEKVSIEQAKQIVNVADSIIEIYKVQLEAVDVFSTSETIVNPGQMMVDMGISETESVKLLK